LTIRLMICISALPVPTVQDALPDTADYFARFEYCLPIAESSMQGVYDQLRELVQPLEQPNDPIRGVLRHLTWVQLREEQDAWKKLEELWGSRLSHLEDLLESCSSTSSTESIATVSLCCLSSQLMMGFTVLYPLLGASLHRLGLNRHGSARERLPSRVVTTLDLIRRFMVQYLSRTLSFLKAHCNSDFVITLLTFCICVGNTMYSMSCMTYMKVFQLLGIRVEAGLIYKSSYIDTHCRQRPSCRALRGRSRPTSDAYWVVVERRPSRVAPGKETAGVLVHWGRACENERVSHGKHKIEHQEHPPRAGIHPARICRDCRQRCSE
jgi:hypothetical protein